MTAPFTTALADALGEKFDVEETGTGGGCDAVTVTTGFRPEFHVEVTDGTDRIPDDARPTRYVFAARYEYGEDTSNARLLYSGPGEGVMDQVPAIADAIRRRFGT